jgi:hypothetical protein
MKDIEGIEQAIAILNPHWGEIEADFNKQNERFLALVAADHNAIGRVLRAHLVIESFLGTFLESRLGIKDVKELRLSFWQKAKLLPDGHQAVSWVKPGIIQVNTVRNKFGHDLNYKIEPHEINTVYEVLNIARKGVQFARPVDAIEAFAPVACAFLTVPPPHLQEMFLQAFAGVKADVYEPPEAASV